MEDTPHNSKEDKIGYNQLFKEAMRGIVRKALLSVRDNGIDDPHCIYIIFATEDEGVEISNSLKSSYPKYMTVVLQHSFEELTVTDSYFSVVLFFAGVGEKIKIPFSAICAFQDRGVNLTLSLRDYIKEEDVQAKTVKRDKDLKSGGKIISLSEYAKTAAKKNQSKNIDDDELA